jgi:hypothetical protein
MERKALGGVAAGGAAAGGDASVGGGTGGGEGAGTLLGVAGSRVPVSLGDGDDAGSAPCKGGGFCAEGAI